MRRILGRRRRSEIGQKPQTDVQITLEDHGQCAALFGFAFFDRLAYRFARVGFGLGVDRGFLKANQFCQLLEDVVCEFGFQATQQLTVF